MYSLILATLIIGQNQPQPMLDRSAFLGSETIVALQEMPRNRFVIDPLLKIYVNEEAKLLAEKYKDNTNALQKRFVRNRLVDRLYGRDGFHGPISDDEDDFIDKVVDDVCKPQLKVAEQLFKQKYSVIINGNIYEVWGKKDIPTGKIRFNLNEQTLNVKAAYNVR